MNRQMKVFNHEQFGNVRIIEEDGRMLFCGSDVAKALGYTNPRKAVRDIQRGERNVPWSLLRQISMV